jgi:hypothetical protein
LTTSIMASPSNPAGLLKKKLSIKIQLDQTVY